MAKLRRGGNKRVIRPTLLLVGEGLAEYNFLAKVKAVATNGGKGPSVTLRQASGKGALHVVEYALRSWKRSDITTCGVFLDGDTSCYERAVAKARQKNIVVMANDPCFEATLLRLKGIYPMAKGSHDCKRDFANAFGDEAHNEEILKRHFSPSDELLQSFNKVEPLGQLLRLLSLSA